MLVVDPPTGMCVAMAGLDRPASGHVGTSPSLAQLQTGSGAAFDRWQTYDGLHGQRLQALAQAEARESIYLPPLITNPTEPETRTLTEATEIIERDWLFQAEGKPLAARTAQEIRWAKELAARLVKAPRAPELSSELAELNALEKRFKAAAGENPTARLPHERRTWPSADPRSSNCLPGVMKPSVMSGSRSRCSTGIAASATRATARHVGRWT